MTAPTSTSDTMQRLRREMPVVEKWAYFDHAALAPMPAPTARRLHQFADQAAREGDVHWMDWVGELEETRRVAARLIAASASEIAFVSNTTEGINLVAEGLDWREGDNVVSLADEFPTNLYPWMHLESRGVETRLVATDNGRIDFDELRQACDRRTRVVSISWIGFQTGYRHNLPRIAEICHAAGALFFVDAIQGLGVFPLDVNEAGIDFLSSSSHKWLLGPEGAGIAYIREECLNQLRPVGVGWNSVVRPFNYSHVELKFKPTAARYEGGSWNMAGILAMGESLRLLESIGLESLAAGVLEFTDDACEELARAGASVTTDREMSPRGGEQRSGIVFFELPGRDPMEFRKRCLAEGIVLSCRAGKLRISPHAYNNEEDLQRLVDLIEK